MKHEKNVNEILLKNYRHWIATAKNPEHRLYAQTMLSAVYNGEHAQMFKKYGDMLNAAYKYKK